MRDWSASDAFLYSALAMNVVVFGWFIFSLGPFIPQGNLVGGVLLTTPFMIVEVIAYSAIISIIPRAGGDYVWQSRIIGGSIAYILALAGYVFIIWHWAPLWGAVFTDEIAAPIATILNYPSSAVWWSGANGIFVSSIVVIAITFAYNAFGMKWYARAQRFLFGFGFLGVIAMVAVLITSSNSAFQAAFDRSVSLIFGGNSSAYQSTINLSASGGYVPPALNSVNWVASVSLAPMLVFYFLWGNWGNTLYGEVKRAADFKKTASALTTAVVFTAVTSVISLLLFAKVFGWDFYNSANNAYWGTVYGTNPGGATSPLPVWPYPGLLAAFLTPNSGVQLLILVGLAGWLLGAMGNLYLTSTRVIFGLAFDRMLPSWMAMVTERTRVPINALLVLAVPGAVLSYLYAYVSLGGVPFSTLTLDAVLPFVLLFMVTGVAVAIIPFRSREMFNASPIMRYKGLVVGSGAVLAAFMAYVLWAWAVNPAYGINNQFSALYTFALYLLAAAVYFGYKYYNKRKGVNIALIYKEIPAE